MNTFQILRDSIQEELQLDQPLPPYLDETVELFRKVHIYYRTYRHIQIHQNADQDPSKGHPAVYGAALQLLGDYTTIGSYAVNVALVTKCAEDLLKEYRQLDDDYQRLCEAIEWKYPLYHHVEWKEEKKETQNLFSPYLTVAWQTQSMEIVRQILKITSCALDVFWQMFKLSMCLCDAYLLCNDDPQIRYEACTELVAEWDQYQSLLKEDQKRLVEEIEKGSELADRILTRLGVQDDSTSIVNQLKEKIEELAEEAEETLDDLYNVGEETLDTVYVKGKITPLHINLTAVNAEIPTFPYSRFPPWGGREMSLSVSQPPKTAVTIEPVENFLLDHIDHFFMTDSVKGVIDLAGCVHQFYHKHVKIRNLNSPFA